ncbi:unnamed protein product [Ilex paraguariensis]|uniref:Uncharacterized protein n=1 Tax=Ilex paraguariensis TaxID=185542 RepID=A0ABC8S3F8_9AQUA
MATLRSITAYILSSPPQPKKPNSPLITLSLSSSQLFTKSNISLNSTFSTIKTSNWVVKSVTEEKDTVAAQNRGSIDQEDELKGPVGRKLENDNRALSDGSDDSDRFLGRAINAAIVLGAGTLAITKLLTIDHDYWHGWTLYEVLRYAPEHNWTAYEEALKIHPVLAKMVISGVVYSLGDWIAQCYEGKPLFDFDRTRMFRSGLVGFSLHGSLSHYYYQFCEALFPSTDWWVVPAKVAFDQTIWAAVWNSVYFVGLGLLRLESSAAIFCELKATFWLMLTAGWKLWPFAHLITYGVIPVEQRLLWVDCVELIWVTILSTYSNEKSEARISEASLEAESNSSSRSGQEQNSAMVSPTLITPTTSTPKPLPPTRSKLTTPTSSPPNVITGRLQTSRRKFLSLTAGTVLLQPVTPAWAASDEEYVKETEEVINKVRTTIAMEKTDPNIATAVAELRESSNSWVAKYRREKALLGRSSFRDVYSALNAVSGHYISFGPTAPIPAKRKARILEEMDTAEKALIRGR